MCHVMCQFAHDVRSDKAPYKSAMLAKILNFYDLEYMCSTHCYDKLEYPRRRISLKPSMNSKA